MKRRNDATYVANLIPYKRIFPYIMPKRTDSLVYHKFSVDLTEGVKFIKHMNRTDPGDHQYRVFELFLAALLRTIVMRPHLNRFLMNYETWQRDELSLNFVVKEDYTDDAPEHSAILYFEPTMTFPEMATIINNTIENSRAGGDNDTDAAIEFFLRFPKWLLRFLVSIIGFLDRKGIAPKALRDADGLHSSAFVANLGSINLLSSPHHHLYEWGTTSIFITMGMLRRRRIINEEGVRSFIDSMDIGVTLDERIADGFYFIRSIQILQDYLNNPQRLMERPDIPPPTPTLKEVKREKKAVKKAERKKKKAERKLA
ncbi:MAG: 2-oxoacid:acceptor oxidoreductase [Sphaerochaetaceae bacterium]|nr:2-oxoacid:acceptor oxidoreductase [Sphaerochaetaceae bacterium]